MSIGKILEGERLIGLKIAYGYFQFSGGKFITGSSGVWFDNRIDECKKRGGGGPYQSPVVCLYQISFFILEFSFCVFGYYYSQNHGDISEGQM